MEVFADGERFVPNIETEFQKTVNFSLLARFSCYDIGSEHAYMISLMRGCMTATKKKAPEFARKLRELVGSWDGSQRELAHETRIPVSSLNRLCNHGIGSENHICVLLDKLGVKRRNVISLLIERRAELTDGKAREVWEGFTHAFLNEDEYLAETCPFLLQRAYACTHLGIPIGDVVTLAKRHNIPNIEYLYKVDLWKISSFVTAFEKKFGKDAKDLVLAENCEGFPPVLLVGFKEQRDAGDYLKLTNCKGTLFFGLPNLVIGDYQFLEGGEIKAHKNNGGVELLFSLQGIFEFVYQGVVCQTKLAPGRSLLLYDARKKHAVRLAKGKRGRLLMVRYDPKRREIQPGHSHRGRRFSKS